MTTITDRKTLTGNSFSPVTLSATDYYAFGAPIAERSFNAGQYRYGFNGKENVTEIKDIQDYGFRYYNTLTARFLSVDPLTKKYPELTPYQFASNSPIENTDLDGLEKYTIHVQQRDGHEQIIRTETDNSFKYIGIPVLGFPIKPRVAQFIYEDRNGKEVNRTKEIALKNFGNTLYVGPFNPKDKYGADDYTLPALNSLDAAAKKHDRAYDVLRSSGAKGALVDLKTLDADKQLIKDAAGVVGMYKAGSIDPVSNKKIDNETVQSAIKVITLFSVSVAEKEARKVSGKVFKEVSEKLFEPKNK
ncbi:unnamed protein product [Rotaria socialis]|uniref:RHS repeat-associated core domain-containing protein n=1 Tax=Rotaria socialis TaxID=392032 RepID=A0A817T2Y8_9BILA|nr:unnamed protein product [Rotaria socialis]CAF4497727.1 unnamed protein product [Rotaria socialis]